MVGSTGRMVLLRFAAVLFIRRCLHYNANAFA